MKISHILSFLALAMPFLQITAIPLANTTSTSFDLHQLEPRDDDPPDPCNQHIFDNVLEAFTSNFGRGGEFRGSEKYIPNFRIACCSGWCMFMAGEGKTMRHWTDEQFQRTQGNLREKVFDRKQYGGCMANHDPGYIQTVEGTHGMRLPEPKHIKRRKEMYLRFMPDTTEIWGHWIPGSPWGGYRRVGSRVKADSCKKGGTVYAGPFLENPNYKEADLNHPSAMGRPRCGA
ncbi:MAG: hypothetical protein M1831_000958 [Alyxoria varia]|nr:MAG: hypothetical protein M1831_000958 [Alyxoria varia]